MAGDGDAAARLAAWLESAGRVLALTGAGISTASGIPGYRDRDGHWQRSQPITHQAFVGDGAARRRYWARSLVGWPLMARATPNAAHRALAALEAEGRVTGVVTQNVDTLHQRAGSRRVVDLHGRLDGVVCLDCGARHPRARMQAELANANPRFAALAAGVAPDGDADLEADFGDFAVPGCFACGGMLKPDVVFYGGSVPRATREAADAALAEADALLVVGSTLMVRSSYRLCEEAARLGKPVAALNLGRTRADALFSLKIEADCLAALAPLAAPAAAGA